MHGQPHVRFAIIQFRYGVGVSSIPTLHSVQQTCGPHGCYAGSN